jgi:uracil-DNA glycosylase
VTWSEWLKSEKEKPYFQALTLALKNEYTEHTVYPKFQDIYTAFKLCPLESTKVVILGQDPYHGPGQAHGLAFSVLPDQSIPPSLTNIYNELYRDLKVVPATHGYLKHWADQGVLLLNTTLTVRDGSPGSHAKLGWEEFTDSVLRRLNDEDYPKAFLLWGNHAKKKGELIDPNKHLILESAHPSPLSAHRGFKGCGHFSQTNAFLESSGYRPIAWKLPPIG